MADLSRLKAKRGFPSPPAQDETPNNLHAPESAPASSEGSDGSDAQIEPSIATDRPDPSSRQLDASQSQPKPANPTITTGPSIPKIPAGFGLTADEDSMSRVDGRSLRKTGRNTPFATRLKEATVSDIKRLAQRRGSTMAEVIEQAVELLKAESTHE